MLSQPPLSSPLPAPPIDLSSGIQTVWGPGYSRLTYIFCWVGLAHFIKNLSAERQGTVSAPCGAEIGWKVLANLKLQQNHCPQSPLF